MNDIGTITQNDYSYQLKEFYELSNKTIQQVKSGMKIKEDISENAKQLSDQLKLLIGEIASNGDVSKYEWTHLQALIVILTREMLIKVQTSYPYNKEGFEDEMDIILQFLAGFEKAPFTLQRICELLLDPLKHYKSSKKVLFAMEKLVNVSMST